MGKGTFAVFKGLPKFSLHSKKEVMKRALPSSSPRPSEISNQYAQCLAPSPSHPVNKPPPPILPTCPPESLCLVACRLHSPCALSSLDPISKPTPTPHTPNPISPSWARRESGEDKHKDFGGHVGRATRGGGSLFAGGDEDGAESRTCNGGDEARRCSCCAEISEGCGEDLQSVASRAHPQFSTFFPLRLFRHSNNVGNPTLRARTSQMERSSCLSGEGGTSTKTPTTETEKKKQEESLDQILSRHKHETAELQNKEMSLKKAAARGSKAEQKAKKKQVENEISQLSMKLKAKQAEELASLGYTNSNGKEKGDLNHLVMAIAGVSVSDQGDPSKPSKSVKRREKRAQQEAAREQRIQEEQSNIISDRMIENEELEKKLKPLGLKVNEIKPDGHCLYRAVEDQLSLQSGSAPYSYRELREMVATYMRAHASDFLPFFLSENETESDSLLERFENYCTEVESTAAWGGQLELRALTHCLRKHIVVFSGSFPDVEMGKEYKSESGSSSSNSSIMLSYHRHAFGLGEHYNSVVPSVVSR
ncbi:hypothetical protein MRB53_032546 [Persea americana]|uniref:Uncharacterized protein n=1 Tax=Persea americana TaxID=3435 RepID=A0ACC2KS67_PERAE|nr:hypothetical protein MRB53_032546 [Persea americana]